jgi:hypothetical protein
MDQVIDFRIPRSSLPNKLLSNLSAGIKIICGEGDVDYGGGNLSVTKYNFYDVFCCYPPGSGTEYETGLIANAKSIIGTDKFICILDFSNSSQVHNFVTLFKNSALLIRNGGLHSPMLQPDACFQLLKSGGLVFVIGDYWPQIVNVGEFTCKTEDFIEQSDGRIYKNKRICYKNEFLPGGKRRKTGRRRRQFKRRKTRKHK